METDNFKEIPISERDKAYYNAPLLVQQNGKLDPRCYLAIDRLKKGPADYKSILGSGKPYTDPDFKADQSSIMWKDLVSPDDLSELGSLLNTNWKRVPDLAVNKSKPLKLFGDEGVTLNDIAQGGLGDCWLLAGLVTEANTPERVRSMFVNKQDAYPKEGLIGMNVRVMNKPYVVTIDDYLPVRQGTGRLAMARGSSDGDFWVPLAEKVFAKIFGTYASMNGGASEEVWRMINGAPSQIVKPKTYYAKAQELFKTF